MKEGELEPQEFQFIRKHPSAGRKDLNDMKSYSENILKMAAEHHEKYDVTGYPFQLKGEKNSLYARVCFIMDVFGALTEMKNNMEGHFDMRILVNFIKILADAAAAKVSASRSSGGSQSPNKQAAASTSFWRAQIKFFQSSGVHAHSVFLCFFSFHPNDLYFTLPAE